jgi:class 3 adenylate cyclase
LTRAVSERSLSESAAAMGTLPEGILTFLLTDVEASTRRWEQEPEMMRQAMVRHDAMFDAVVDDHHGHIVKPRGEGDSRFAVFTSAHNALAAAAEAQQRLFSEPWETLEPIRVRMAIHTGEADLRGGDYYGTTVNRCARLRSLAHGGQTLISLASEQLVRDELPRGVQLKELGRHRLKDLTQPEHVVHRAHHRRPLLRGAVRSSGSAGPRSRVRSSSR